ncbi:hypothetical protein D3C81_889270 [compost metagenome]
MLNSLLVEVIVDCPCDRLIHFIIGRLLREELLTRNTDLCGCLFTIVQVNCVLEVGLHFTNHVRGILKLISGFNSSWFEDQLEGRTVSLWLKAVTGWICKITKFCTAVHIHFKVIELE